MKTEYDWLLQFYLQLVSFDVVTSTFIKLKEEDRASLLLDINSLKQKFEKLLPSIQEIG